MECRAGGVRRDTSEMLRRDETSVVYGEYMAVLRRRFISRPLVYTALHAARPA